MYFSTNLCRFTIESVSILEAYAYQIRRQYCGVRAWTYVPGVRASLDLVLSVLYLVLSAYWGTMSEKDCQKIMAHAVDLTS